MTDPRSELPFSRWWLVVVSALALGAVGTYQFVWSSIRVSLGSALGTTETGLGTVFTVFLIFQSLSQFPAGWVRDRYGPRIPLLIGTPLLVAGYVWTGSASALWEVLVAYGLGGVGSGIVYTVAVNTPVKWFTDRRGLATGAVMTAYSGVSFLLIPVVRQGVQTALGETLTLLGVGVGAAALLGAIVLSDPSDASDSTESTENSPATDDSTTTDPTEYGWRETIKTWQFWLLYGVFVVINGAGLMLIGKVVAYAEVLALPAAVATASASVVAFSDSLGMALIGAVSDRFGRVRTVGISLVLSGIALAGAAVAGAGATAWLFAGLAGAAALFRSPAFAIFPSLVGDYYGQSHSSENYALLYTGKVWGSVLGGTVASVLVVSLGWTTSFLLAAGGLVLAGIVTLPLRPPTREEPAETATTPAN
jgi:OFA family oxalate/formate antiporter-like MFS transporter